MILDFLVAKACNYDCYFYYGKGASEVIRRHKLSVKIMLHFMTFILKRKNQFKLT